MLLTINSDKSSKFVIVKILTLLFSLYFSMLAAMPCTDIAVNRNQDFSKIEKSHDHASHPDEADSCSPFCICNCCGTPILNLNSTLLFANLNISQISKTPISTYKTPLFSKFFGSIWQPPQLHA